MSERVDSVPVSRVAGNLGSGTDFTGKGVRTLTGHVDLARALRSDSRRQRRLPDHSACDTFAAFLGLMEVNRV